MQGSVLYASDYEEHVIRSNRTGELQRLVICIAGQTPHDEWLEALTGPYTESSSL